MPGILELTAAITLVRIRIEHTIQEFGHGHPHVMIFGGPFGSPFPQVSDDAGTPFFLIVIPVDDKLAQGNEMK